ncbi:MAG: hypothetical protein WAP54_07190 [Bacteroidales bacterium]
MSTLIGIGTALGVGGGGTAAAIAGGATLAAAGAGIGTGIAAGVKRIAGGGKDKRTVINYQSPSVGSPQAKTVAAQRLAMTSGGASGQELQAGDFRTKRNIFGN